MNKPKELQFHEAMLNIYRTAKSEVGYNATRFLQMVSEKGGFNTAVTLLESEGVSDGFTELFLRGNRLDLSVEYLVLQSTWRELFTDQQLAIARNRLEERNFEVPA